MYKRITHTIVEEHFDIPKKVKWKAPLRFYSDGEQISSSLPKSYQLAMGDSKCGNCLALDPVKNVCMYWQTQVRADYVCGGWTAVK
jgi:hypothetical protein